MCVGISGTRCSEYRYSRVNELMLRLVINDVRVTDVFGRQPMRSVLITYIALYTISTN